MSEPTPGVFFGSGNANGSWTVDTAKGIELGLRTHQRYPSPANVFNSGGDGTYAWADQLGYTGSDRSSWNYDFSINVAGTNLAVGDFTFQLWIDSDPGAGHAWTFFDPSSIPDNAVSGTAYEQNSENVRFSGVGIPGYNNTIAGSYDFSLRAYDKTSGDLLANTYMRVNVNNGTATGAFNGSVPDSGTTLVLLGGALTGLGALRRKFRA
ncbi:MAG: VPDSG-CTERM sorting domain-containing protein [Verrucomicrobia bacterium]|nr:VPDSG-CTERM sorting domain-containing protein [Verrucomicrobiota bacterium]